MSTIASLNINLSAGIAGFNRGINQAISGLGRLGSAATSLNTVLAGLAGGLTVAGVTAFVHSQMEAVDAAAKVSDQLGIQTERLTELQYAANLAGVDAETFADALKKMSVNIADPSDAAGSAFAKLGVDLAAIQQLAPDQQLRVLADAFSRVEGQGQRAALAIDVFGKQGVKLLNTVQGGAAVLDVLAGEAQAFGVAVSRVDAAKIEAANDAITRVGVAIKGVATQAAIVLAPAIEFVATKMTDFIKESGGVRSVVVTGFRLLVGAVGVVADALSLVQAAFYGLRSAAGTVIAWLTEQLASLARSMDEIFEKLTGKATGAGAALTLTAANLRAAVSDDADGMARALADFSAGTNSTAVLNWFDALEAAATKSAQGVADAMGKNSAAVKDFADDAAKQMDEVMKALDRLREEDANFGLSANEKALRQIMASNASIMTKNEAAGLVDSISQKEAQAKALKDLQDFGRQITDEVRTPVEIFADQIDRLNAALDAGIITQETYGRAVDAAQEKLNQAGKVDTGGNTRLAATEARFLTGFARPAATDPQARMARDTSETRKNTERAAAALETIQQNQLLVAVGDI